MTHDDVLSEAEQLSYRGKLRLTQHAVDSPKKPLKGGLHPSLERILTPAYHPCQEFSNNCKVMRWNPDAGHVPRGFLGACGELSEVELVLVFAEPGDPQAGEKHSGLQSAYDYAMLTFDAGLDQFHRNVRKILDMCWPGMPFQEQMHKAWLTDSVLCSAPKECGSVSISVSNACGRQYLTAQLALFPNALIVALGTKAQNRLRSLGVTDFVPAYAVAPPGCNRQEALESWKKIPLELRRRRDQG